MNTSLVLQRGDLESPAPWQLLKFPAQWEKKETFQILLVQWDDITMQAEGSYLNPLEPRYS